MYLIACTGEPSNLQNVKSWLETAALDHVLVVAFDGKDCYDEEEIPRYTNRRVVVAQEKGGPVATMQAAWSSIQLGEMAGSVSRTECPLAFIHDDVIIRDIGWDERALREFADPTVGVVGFGGATGLGHPQIYQIPYELPQLARHGYASNVDDWRTHGGHFEGSRDVAVLDGFSLIVRRELMDKLVRWPVDKLVFHNYDFWLCCMARRLGYRVRQVGVRCHHLGGRNSTRPRYNGWLQERLGKTDSDVHREAHEFVYEEFRDVLPVRA